MADEIDKSLSRSSSLALGDNVGIPVGLYVPITHECVTGNTVVAYMTFCVQVVCRPFNLYSNDDAASAASGSHGTPAPRMICWQL